MEITKEPLGSAKLWLCLLAKPLLLTHVVEPDGDVVVDGVKGGDDHGQKDLGAEPQELGVALGAILK